MISPERPTDMRHRVVSGFAEVLVLAAQATQLACVVGIHKCVDWIMEWAVPEGWHYGVGFLHGVFFCGFAVIYVHMVWEMVLTFVPWLRTTSWYSKGRRNQPSEKDEASGGGA
jgi:hypothetical protein